MRRRTLLKTLTAGALTGGAGAALLWRRPVSESPEAPVLPKPAANDRPPAAESLAEVIPDVMVEPNAAPDAREEREAYLEKIRNFDETHAEDVFLEGERFALLKATVGRLDRVQTLVGYGNFNLLSFDDMLRYARGYDRVGAFSRAELDFIEEIFFADARRYGFLGDKVVDRLTARFPEKEARKIPGSGHYVFRGEPTAMYEKVRRDVGDSLVLTSGVRSVVKQIHLFLAKAVETEGNLSRASRSLAPPGHSYHGIGDFDVGKVGLGARNFTSAFAETDEFKRLQDLGYIDIRYTDHNPYGVRFEPWHIKVV